MYKYLVDDKSILICNTSSECGCLSNNKIFRAYNPKAGESLWLGDKHTFTEWVYLNHKWFKIA